jgi:HSP20 family protein
MSTSTSMTKQEDRTLENVQARPAVAPRVDVFENKDELLLVADMPGVSEHNLDIHLEKEQLTISGRCDDETAATVMQREWRGADFRRSFVIPSGIDSGKVSAELKDGVLWLHLPKSERLKPRRIEVKAG